tara:strand:+ start:43 stop:1992 length:1950 start_codon:yes stop_codon:yes gene_type:complete
MARATLEMFLKLTGADKTSRGLDKVSGSADRLDNKVKRGSKANAQFAAGMSGLTKGAVVGAAVLAGKALINFSADALEAAVSAEEAAAAFDTTFGDAAQEAGRFSEQFANKAGLTNAELQQLLATTGAVAQGIGFTQKESADLGIELTKIAADVASFSNISAGAEPVLLAFRSALLGEREALKTYGIAISEAEVQTKAFELTGKSSANALTRQEKAFATLAVIQQKAAVQIGDLDRTSESFANQQRAVSAEIRQLKEDIGAELIPAAAEMLPIFRELVNDIAPPTINFFKETALFTADVALAFENLSLKAEALSNNFPKLNSGLLKFIEFVKNNSPIFALLNAISGLADEQREFNIVIDDTAEKIIAQQIAQGLANKEAEKARQITLKQETQYTNISRTLKNKLNPILGEQNRLIAENVDLELDRNKVLNLLSSANDNVEKAEKDRNKALKDVKELTIAENLADAQAAVRKSELQTQIALLTQAEESGKDVTNELALARAELAEAEFELANESDSLVRAREILEIAENNLTTAIDNQKKALDKRNETLLQTLDLTAKQSLANDKLAESFKNIDLSSLVGLPVGAPVTTAPATTEVPSLPASDFTTTLVGGRQQTSTIDVNLNLTDAIGEIIQEQNIKIQERGNTFVLEG